MFIGNGIFKSHSLKFTENSELKLAKFGISRIRNFLKINQEFSVTFERVVLRIFAAIFGKLPSLCPLHLICIAFL